MMAKIANIFLRFFFPILFLFSFCVYGEMALRLYECTLTGSASCDLVFWCSDKSVYAHKHVFNIKSRYVNEQCKDIRGRTVVDLTDWDSSIVQEFIKVVYEIVSVESVANRKEVEILLKFFQIC